MPKRPWEETIQGYMLKSYKFVPLLMR